MELNEQISTIYQYFYMKYVNNSNYLFVPTESQKKSIDKFIEFLDSEIGKHSVSVNYLFNFFAYQFYFYSKPGNIKSKRYMQVTHIIGEKAIERWTNKNYYIEIEASDWCRINDYLCSEITEIVEYQPAISFNQLEDIERKRFLNTEYGLSNCLMLTNGYSSKSNCCKQCKFSVECRQIT